MLPRIPSPLPGPFTGCGASDRDGAAGSDVNSPTRLLDAVPVWLIRKPGYMITLRRTAQRITTASAALLVGLVCGCATMKAAGDEKKTIRVMTYNIHHAEGVDGKIDLLRISDLIKRERADIVALQEVDQGVERTQKRDLPAELAELTGMTCIFSNNFHYEGGQYGNAVLTRFPVKRWTNLHYKMVRPGEQRGLLQLVLEIDGREVLFMNTHVDFRPDDAERWSNAGEIEQLLPQYRGLPIFMCGDFNDTPGSRTCRRIAEKFDDAWMRAGQGDGFTIPSGSPRKRIDYIWISKGESIEPIKLWVPKTEASDHLPVVGEFRIRL
jgi:endonuclease/exonuclease/phosphatase family metal-dependent hydrolase